MAAATGSPECRTPHVALSHKRHLARDRGTVKTISLVEFKGLVRARVTEAVSLRQCARDLGVQAAGLSRLLTKAHVQPGPQLLKIFGYRRVVRYEKATK